MNLVVNQRKDEENDRKDSQLEVNVHVRILKYKYIFVKD